MGLGGLDYLEQIPTGVRGTRRTIIRMAQLVNEGKRQRPIINLAQSIVSHVRERDHWGEVNAIFTWVKENIRFVNDVEGVETLRRPLYILTESRSADCDDLSTLLNTLCASIGYRTAFKTIKANKANPNEYSHVYSLIYIDGKWIPADASQSRPLGWEPTTHMGSKVWNYDNGSLKSMGSLGMNTNDIFSQVVNAIINRGKKKPQPQPQQVIPVTKNPSMDFPDDEVMEPLNFDSNLVNTYPFEEFDYDTHRYYGGDDDTPPGTYSYQEKELIYPQAALKHAVPTPQVIPENYGDYYSLDKKFAKHTKVVERRTYRTAVKDGTPSPDELKGQGQHVVRQAV